MLTKWFNQQNNGNRSEFKRLIPDRERRKPTQKAENREPTKADQFRYKVFKITGSKKFMITKDLFAPVWELTYNQRTFKGLEADIIKQLKQYQQLGVYQTVLIFI